MVVFWRNLAGQHCIPPGVSERSVGSWKMPMRMRPTTVRSGDTIYECVCVFNVLYM